MAVLLLVGPNLVVIKKRLSHGQILPAFSTTSWHVYIVHDDPLSNCFRGTSILGPTKLMTLSRGMKSLLAVWKENLRVREGGTKAFMLSGSSSTVTVGGDQVMVSSIEVGVSLRVAVLPFGVTRGTLSQTNVSMKSSSLHNPRGTICKAFPKCTKSYSRLRLQHNNGAADKFKGHNMEPKYTLLVDGFGIAPTKEITLVEKVKHGEYLIKPA
ncbi:hypothetical protein VPH35_049094 [Triticum aestivum]|uniref:Uncharacterized protein n=1 Tax=Triticum aestivum TaxID=4565 RepID=A0A077RRW4_WHEAT|nr:unnamed protein product [Triticum aestivum]